MIDMEDVEKISIITVANFVGEFFRFKETKYRDLRFGQAFLNYFYPHLSCPELYYQEEYKKAEQYILEHFVKEE